MAMRLEDYALIGDCETAALVGRDGSIDWLCLPRFDSGACFSALLGGPEHGRFQLCPEDPQALSSWRYRPNTLILETEWRSSQGRALVIDYMPPRDNHPDLIRLVVGLQGEVPMRLELGLRFDYGSVIPRLRPDDFGMTAVAGPDLVQLSAPVPLQEQNSTIYSHFVVKKGQQLALIMRWQPSDQSLRAALDPEKALSNTESWWRSWAEGCTYQGPWKEKVKRSLITLKALTYPRTGGIIAAPTTSLPEQIGGTRNWDYRYCWVRDATFTLYALMSAGYRDEAQAWREWLLRAGAGMPSQLQIMYGVGGERRLIETELEWLPGYENSKPVRVGNNAYRQFQLDVFGELMDALHVARRIGLRPSPFTWDFQKALIEYLESAWDRPDEGIWEVRGPRRHFTHSKVMAWVALDRAITAVQTMGLAGPLDRWKALRSQIHEQVCNAGFDPELNSFVQYYGAKTLDASLLMLSLVGFLPAQDPRVVGTVRAIEKHLMREGFVQRYTWHPQVDNLPEGEGVFLACTFWLADNWILLGERERAQELFERLIGVCSDLGLLSEQYDPQKKRLIGNYPQAFSHVALINTALNLESPSGPAHDRKGSNL